MFARYGKYNAKKVKTPDGVFDSMGEWERWCQLVMLARAGKVADLKRQVEFPLKVNDTLVCKYKADYTYTENGVAIVEDFKGVLTKEFKLKASLFFALHGYPIRVSSKKGCAYYPKPVKKKKENKHGKKTRTLNPPR